jgi:tetratricopeptide (TPR) repeat protein
VLTNLGTLLANLGESRRARELTARAIAIDERALGPDHPDLATSLYGLAQIDASLDDRAGARTLLQRALAIRERAFGAGHPQVAEVLLDLGNVDLADGDAKAAQASLERALTIVEGVTEGINPMLPPLVRFSLAKALRAAGTSERAEALAAAAIADAEAIGKEHFGGMIAEVEAWRAAGTPRR